MPEMGPQAVEGNMRRAHGDKIADGRWRGPAEWERTPAGARV